MATLRTTLPALYLDRAAYLEDVLYEEMPIEAGVFQRILKVRDMGNKPLVRTTTVASFGLVPTKAEGAPVTYEDLAAGFSGMGYKISPAVGLAMAELLLEGRGRCVDLSIFDPGRFAAGRPIRAPHEYSDE